MVTKYLAQKQFRDIRDKLDSIRKLSNSIQIDVVVEDVHAMAIEQSVVLS